MKKKVTIPLLEIDEVVAILNRISIFAGLSDDQLYVLFRHLEEIHYKKGEVIFEPGDEPSRIFIVWEGQVEIFLQSDSFCLVKSIFDVGHCFGEVPVIGIQRHTAGAMAREACRLIVLPKSVLFSFFETDKDLFSILILNIAREACRRLAATNESLLHYVSREE